MGIDLYLDAERLQHAHELEEEVGYRACDQWHAPGVSVAEVNPQVVIDEVEVDLEHALADGDRRRGQSARGHGKRDVPPFIEEWRKRQLDFADDLRAHVERGAGLLPF